MKAHLACAGAALVTLLAIAGFCVAIIDPPARTGIDGSLALAEATLAAARPSGELQ